MMGLNFIQENELFNISIFFALVTPLNKQRLENMAESEEREQSVLTLGSHAAIAFPVMCGIQREAKKKMLF